MHHNEVNNEVDNNQFIHFHTHINHGEVHANDSNLNYDDIHALDLYANIFYDNNNEIDNDFFFQTTEHDIDTNFVIPTPKQTHHTPLAPVVLLKIKAITGMKLT